MDRQTADTGGAVSVAFICSALDRLSEVAKKHGHKLISIEIGSMKVVLG